jgi:guanosine-3',5'-bis(diphosphate) 3'-pyrophosphohydrolase
MTTAQESIEAAAERSALVRRAYEVASEAHAGQTRNASGGRPYIDHPVAVAAQLLERGLSDEVLAAALLHDVVEDSELEIPDIREAGGSRVAELVAVLSDDESLDSYEERKREHRERVEAAGPDALAIYVADKLTNVEMMRDAYAEKGEQIAEELKVPLDVKIAVWEADLAMAGKNAEEGEPAAALAARLSDQLSRLRADRAAAGPRP